MSAAFSEALKSVLGGRVLETDQARRAMGFILGNGATPAQAGAFLGAVILRGAACEELIGFGQAVREKCVKVEVKRSPLLEVCGTAAPGAFHVSTIAAFIAAGAGAAVALQVGRGAADVLEALGIRADQKAGQCVEEAGAGFFPFKIFHPALQGVASLRRELGGSTVFDLLESLANPAGARRQVVGVCAPAMAPILARALQALGSEAAMVVSSRDGRDALSPGAPSAIAHLCAGRVNEYEVDAETRGFKRSTCADFSKGEPAANAKILLGVLKGERGPVFDAAILNSAAALVVAGKAADFKEGLALAEESVDSCRAIGVLEAVKHVGQ